MVVKVVKMAARQDPLRKTESHPVLMIYIPYIQDFIMRTIKNPTLQLAFLKSEIVTFKRQTL